MEEFRRQWYVAAPGNDRAQRLLRRRASAPDDEAAALTLIGILAAISFIFVLVLAGGGTTWQITLVVTVISSILATLRWQLRLQARFERAVKHGHILRVHPTLHSHWLGALKQADVTERFAADRLAPTQFQALVEMDGQYRSNLVNQHYTDEVIKPQLATMAQQLHHELEQAQTTPAQKIQACSPNYLVGPS
jgi:hypothetical protein